MRIARIPAVAAGAVLAVLPLAAHADPAARPVAAGSFTYAVYGDAPYEVNPTATTELDATPAFIDAVNADPDVSTVVHVGDIHSGKQYCTEPYDRRIADLFTRFTDPLVYTPGDNEWTDCHKTAEGGGKYNASTGQVDFVRDTQGNPVDYAGGDPVQNLALVRSIFFPQPGATLGSGSLHTTSQAVAFDPAHPEDAAYVENVMWQQRGFVFVTLNIPGASNNDTDPWYGAPTMSDEQATEVRQRTAADLRWLDRAFATAADQDAQGLVVIDQADLWDLDSQPRTHLSEYEPIVKSLAEHTAAFGRPVLALEGDSHVYRSDNPLQQGAACAGDGNVCTTYDDWNTHPYYDVPNFHRIVVHGSTVPLEYLELVVTPGAHWPTTDMSFGPFSWTRHRED
jgi:hypothetical protein